MGERRRVEGHDSLEKDMHSNAVVNRDTTAFEKARRRKEAFERDRQEKQQLKEQVNGLEKKMDNIESMLEKLLGERNE